MHAGALLLLYAAFLGGHHPQVASRLARGRTRVHAAAQSEQWTSPSSILSNEGIDISGDGGCLKTILNIGQLEEPNPFGIFAGRPPMGARVQVHYVGWLLDGTQFDSSRDRGTPFEFVLGANTVIKGWETAIASMNRDELALVRCRADYAYGPYGVRPLIPPNATLDYELELVGWEDYDPGMLGVEGENPFDDDDDEPDEITLDLDEFELLEQSRTPSIELERAGPLRGRAISATGQSYAWEESESSVTVFVALPETLGSRDVTCKVTARTISLEVPAAGVSLCAPLKGRVYSEDAYWLIDTDADGSRCIQVFMDKEQTYEMWGGALDEPAALDLEAGQEGQSES
jgi:FKBP-type peptidyl-prolyl cis-trans isomerase